MSKFFSICVPQFKEDEKIIKNLLDSIAIQQNIDFDEVEVIICGDGPDSVKLSREFLDSYPYDIQYYVSEKHEGVSWQRNNAFNHATGEYVSFNDADDQYYHCLAFWLIKRETTTPMQVMVNDVPTTVVGFDALYSVFVEEGRNPQNGETYFIDRSDGFQFTHGKWIRRQFMIDNDIHFFPECTIHEDNVLNGQIQACTNRIKWCPAPFYLWKWRDESVCRRDPDYLLKTYIDLIKSSDHLIDWYKSKSKWDNARQTICQLIYDGYYSMCCKKWKEVNSKEYREQTEKRFGEFYRKYKKLWEEAPDQLKMGVSNGIRQRNVMYDQMEMETETLKQFLERIENLA